MSEGKAPELDSEPLLFPTPVLPSTAPSLETLVRQLAINQASMLKEQQTFSANVCTMMDGVFRSLGLPQGDPTSRSATPAPSAGTATATSSSSTNSASGSGSALGSTAIGSAIASVLASEEAQQAPTESKASVDVDALSRAIAAALSNGKPPARSSSKSQIDVWDKDKEEDEDDVVWVSKKLAYIQASYHSFHKWLSEVEWKAPRNRFEAETLCAALDALVDHGIETEHPALLILLKRLAGLHMADYTGRWTAADYLTGRRPGHSFLTAQEIVKADNYGAKIEKATRAKEEAKPKPAAAASPHYSPPTVFSSRHNGNWNRHNFQRHQQREAPVRKQGAPSAP